MFDFLIALFTTSSSSSSWYFFSHVGLDQGPLSQNHCTKDMLPMKIYPYQSYRREIIETEVNYTCNWQKVWDSSDSLNGNSCSLLFFIWSTIPMISGDFLTRWNAITMRKGRKKGIFHILGCFSWRSFRSLTLWRNHLHSQPFKLRRGCM